MQFFKGCAFGPYRHNENILPFTADDDNCELPLFFFAFRNKNNWGYKFYQISLRITKKGLFCQITIVIIFGDL
jgi:hypothetical protein